MASKQDAQTLAQTGAAGAGGFAAAGPIGAVGAMGASLALAGFGADAQAQARAKQRRINEAMSRMYGKLYNDEALTGLKLDGTAFTDIEADPQSIEAQRRALDYIAEVQAGRGLTAEDKADMFRIKQNQLSTEQNQRGALEQQAASRGVLNSGMTLSSALNNSQNQANRAQQYGLDVASQSQSRALDAAMKGGYLGSTMRGQSFDEQAKKAAAEDMLAKFNSTMTQQQFENREGIMDRQSGLEGQRGSSFVQDAAERKSNYGTIANVLGQTGKAVFGAPNSFATAQPEVDPAYAGKVKPTDWLK